MKNRASWDELFILMTRLYARRSACKHFQVGIVFVLNKRVLSAGYNGPPINEPHCFEVGCAKEDSNGKRLPADSGLCRGAHAEMNALANASKANVDLEGSTVYCTFSPCYDCAKVLVNLGIRRFVFEKDYKDEGEESLALQLFRRHKIEAVKIIIPTIPEEVKGKVGFIEATSISDAWFQALSKIMADGRRYLITKGSYEGIHRVGMPITIVINNPDARPLHPLMPEGSSIPPPTSEQDINDYLEYLMTSERKENEHYTYGEDLHWQIEWCIKHYKEAGYGNNHCYMTVGRPETVFFYDRDVDYYEEISAWNIKINPAASIVGRKISNKWNKNPEEKPSSQCLRGIDTWIDDGKLNFWVYFRSWDLWGGFPVNLGGIQLLKEYMASEIGVEDGIMVVSCKDLHVYEHTWAVALMRLRKDEKILER